MENEYKKRLYLNKQVGNSDIKIRKYSNIFLLTFADLLLTYDFQNILFLNYKNDYLTLIDNLISNKKDITISIHNNLEKEENDIYKLNNPFETINFLDIDLNRETKYKYYGNYDLILNLEQEYSLENIIIKNFFSNIIYFNCKYFISIINSQLLSYFEENSFKILENIFLNIDNFNFNNFYIFKNSNHLKNYKIKNIRMG
jgi:hypothetical protein